MANLFVTNALGQKEPFSRKKVYRSAKRAGASGKTARKIAETIAKTIYPGIGTAEIFLNIRELLHKEIPQAALRFSIKDALRKLGPTGFPFEKYVAEIMKSLGYKTKINQIIYGHCIEDYEIDFLAEKDKTVYAGECKYRQLFGERVDSMYVLENYARFFDILEGDYFKKPKYRGFTVKSMMVTNTKFTDRAAKYAGCHNINLLGWNHPKNRGLEYLIEKEKLYPITILPALKGYLKEIFSREKMMLAKDLLRIDLDIFSRKFKIPPQHLASLVKQAETLLK